MVYREAILRVARPTDNLEAITEMYISGLGFKLLGKFENHEGFNGSIIGHEHHPFHLEFTHHIGTKVGKSPTQDNLLVFYVPNEIEWSNWCAQMTTSGFRSVASYNPYWDKSGSTFEDVDGYRIVLQKSEWLD
ncbi:MAG: VOC family protein [Halioglobus sp.]